MKKCYDVNLLKGILEDAVSSYVADVRDALDVFQDTVEQTYDMDNSINAEDVLMNLVYMMNQTGTKFKVEIKTKERKPETIQNVYGNLNIDKMENNQILFSNSKVIVTITVE